MFIDDFEKRQLAIEAEKNDSNVNNNDNTADATSTPISNSNADNIWIMKRYQGKQSMDYPITQSLSCALRHLDPCGRLASKYVSNPCLLSNKKFDLRFYVIVKSLQPLVVYCHKFFVIRWSNSDYSASDFEEYQKHFTVMNFLDDVELQHVRGAGKRRDIHRDQFIPLFNSEHPIELSSSSSGSSGGCWESVVMPRVHALFRDVFSAAGGTYSSELPHPYGLAIHPNSGKPNKFIFVCIYPCPSFFYLFTRLFIALSI